MDLAESTWSMSMCRLYSPDILLISVVSTISETTLVVFGGGLAGRGGGTFGKDKGLNTWGKIKV